MSLFEHVLFGRAARYRRKVGGLWLHVNLAYREGQQVFCTERGVWVPERYFLRMARGVWRNFGGMVYPYEAELVA